MTAFSPTFSRKRGYGALGVLATMFALAGSAAAGTADGAACERGDAEACAREGRRLAEPTDASAADLTRGFRLADRACKLGSDDGCNWLSSLYEYGRGVPADMAKAVAIVRASCDRGRPGGCLSLGGHLLDGTTGRPDVAAALSLCLEGPPRARAHWCAALGRFIDQGRAPGGREMMLKVYARACSAEVDVGCRGLASARFRFGRRQDGLALGDRVCAGGDQVACEDMKELRAMMAREQRDGGGPPGTPPAPLRLRAPAQGIAYDPPGDTWGTGVPTHEAGPNSTVWRWWRPGTQLEVSSLRAPPAWSLLREEAALAAALETLARGMVAPLAAGATVNAAPDTLADRPCSHAWLNMRPTGRADLYVTYAGGSVYSLLVLQHAGFDPRLLDRAKAGLRIGAK